MTTLKFPPPYRIYLWLISALGLLWVGLAFSESAEFLHSGSFWFLFLLVIASQYLTQVLPVTDKSGIIYSVSGALAMAALPLFGGGAAILIEAVSMTSHWIMYTLTKEDRSVNVLQLLFNLGMGTTAIFLVIQAYTLLGGNLANDPNLIRQGIIWLIVGIIYDQTNLLLLIIVLWLQQRTGINPFQFWRKNNWASAINLVNIVFVGGMFVLAVNSLGTLGMMAFFMPIAMSAYSFRIYVSQTKHQMDNLESIITERTEELESLNREKDDFLAVLTHDMKSPLMSIGMYASMLQQNPQLLQAKPHTINNILRAQGTLNELVNNIVDLEKLKAGSELTLDLTPFDLSELIEFVTESLQPQANRSKQTLTYKPFLVPVVIVADRLKIERVLTNLISNAVKYTPKNGRVDVRLRLEAEHLEVAVIDTGYGIPADELPYIFERFRRVEQHRRVAVGTGLGLAIAKLIAEAHGGTIEVQSEVNIGSTFILKLPNQSAS